MRKRVTIEYFSVLRETSGLQKEEFETADNSTAGDIYKDLAAKYHFSLTLGEVRVAVNDAFVNDETVPKNGDHVVFIPPVAGG